MKPKQIIYLIVILLIGGVLGFFAGRSGGQKATQTNTTPTTQANQLFRSQTATFQGEITKVNSGSLEVKSDSNQTGSLTLSDRVVIYKFKEGTNQATASSDLTSIETGKKVLIVLNLLGNQYKVVSISYQPPPAAAKPSSTTAPAKKK